MNRKTLYTLTLFAFALLQIGFFVMSEDAFARLQKVIDGGGGGGGGGGVGGGGTLPATRTTQTTQTSSTVCGETSTITITQISRLFGITYRLVQVIEDGTFTRTIWDDTHQWHEVTDYERDLDAVLRGVIGYRQGTIFVTSNPTGVVTNYTEGKSYNLYSGEVAKIAKLTRHQELVDPVVGVLVEQDSDIQFEYGVSGNLLRVGGGRTGFSKASNIADHFSEVYRYIISGGVPLLSHVEVHRHIKDGRLSSPPNVSDLKWALDYGYDASGNLLQVTAPPEKFLYSTEGGPTDSGYGYVADIQPSFTIAIGVPYISREDGHAVDWTRPDRTCTNDWTFTEDVDSCGRVTNPRSTGISACTIRSSSTSTSSTSTSSTTTSSTTTLDAQTQQQIDMVKDTIKGSLPYLKPYVEVRGGS